MVNLLALLLILFLETGGFFKRVEPGKGSGTDIAIIFLIIFIMVLLSLVSRPKISRWPNITFGIIFLMNIIVGLARFWDDVTTGIAINEIWGAIAAALIIWYGWKIPNQAEDEIT